MADEAQKLELFILEDKTVLFIYTTHCYIMADAFHCLQVCMGAGCVKWILLRPKNTRYLYFCYYLSNSVANQLDTHVTDLILSHWLENLLHVPFSLLSVARGGEGHDVTQKRNDI